MNFKSSTVLALSLMLVLSAASAGTLDRVKQSKKLTFAYVADLRPFSFNDEGGKPAGYAVEICRQLAEAVKTELAQPALAVNFVQISREEGLAAVSKGKADLLCAAVPQTLGSRKNVSYSLPIFASGVGAVVRKEGSTRLKDILSDREQQARPTWRANADQVIQRSTLSVVEGSHAQKVLEERLKELKLAATIYPVADYDSGIARVAENRTDAFFGDRAILLDTVKRQGGAKVEVLDRYFTHEVGSLVLPRGDEDFRFLVDRSLSRLYRSAEFKDLYAKWFGPPSANALTFFRLAALPE